MARHRVAVRASVLRLAPLCGRGAAGRPVRPVAANREFEWARLLLVTSVVECVAVLAVTLVVTSVAAHLRALPHSAAGQTPFATPAPS